MRSLGRLYRRTRSKLRPAKLRTEGDGPRVNVFQGAVTHKCDVRKRGAIHAPSGGSTRADAAAVPRTRSPPKATLQRRSQALSARILSLSPGEDG